MPTRRPSRPTAGVVTTLIAGSAAAFVAGADAGDVIYDNGGPDGVNAYSNMTRDVQGAQRTLLDDFVVDVPWIISGLRHHAIWDTLDPGAGVSMDILILRDDENTPGLPFERAFVSSYEEQATGEVFFEREAYVAFTSFEAIALPPGRYWLKATVVGPENNFWLTAPVLNQECWVDYDDVDGLVPGSAMFGSEADLAWSIVGERCLGEVGCCFDNGTCKNIAECSTCLDMGGTPLGAGVLCGEATCPPPCIGDLDGTRRIDFGDIVLLLSAWGECPPGLCRGDLDGDRQVGFTDLLVLLNAWGPCS